MPTEAAQILDSAEATPPATQSTATQSPAPGATQETKPPEVPEERFASKLEVLLKREQQAMERERQAKEMERGLEPKLSRIKEFEDVRERKDVKKALELLGLSYDELTQAMLNDGSVPPEAQVRKLEEKFEQFKTEKQKEDEAREAQLKKHAEENEQKVIGEFKGQIKQYIKDNAPRYELTAFEEQQDLVFDVIDEHYKRTIDPSTGAGKIMSIQEAADKVELFLEQKETKRKELSKIKTIWGMLPPQAQKQVQSQARQKTLTNSLTASPPAPIKKVPISDEERVQRAIAYARGIRPDLR